MWTNTESIRIKKKLSFNAYLLSPNICKIVTSETCLEDGKPFCQTSQKKIAMAHTCWVLDMLKGKSFTGLRMNISRVILRLKSWIWWFKHRILQFFFYLLEKFLVVTMYAIH